MLLRDDAKDVLIVAVGSMAASASTRPSCCAPQGIGVTVVDPRWVKPIDPALVELAAGHRLVVDPRGQRTPRRHRVGVHPGRPRRRRPTPVRVHGIEQEFLDHAKRDVILKRLGLTPQAIADDTLAALSRNTAEG